MRESDALITVITCWEGQIVAAVTTWMARHLHRSADYFITESAPERLLAEGSAEAVQRLQARLTLADVNARQHTLYLIGHAHCAGTSQGEGPPEPDLMPQALARLQTWYPKCALAGMWVDAAGQMSFVAAPPLLPERH